jgi:hypothetical protein
MYVSIINFVYHGRKKYSMQRKQGKLILDKIDLKSNSIIKGKEHCVFKKLRFFRSNSYQNVHI